MHKFLYGPTGSCFSLPIHFICLPNVLECGKRLLFQIAPQPNCMVLQYHAVWWPQMPCVCEMHLGSRQWSGTCACLVRAACSCVGNVTYLHRIPVWTGPPFYLMDQRVRVLNWSADAFRCFHIYRDLSHITQAMCESVWFCCWLKPILCYRNGATTVVTSVFGGVLQNEVNCLICGTESRKFDPFLGLSS